MSWTPDMSAAHLAPDAVARRIAAGPAAAYCGGAALVPPAHGPRPCESPARPDQSAEAAPRPPQCPDETRGD